MKKIFFSFADFVCEIEAPKKQMEYILKCYKKSPFAQFVTLKPGREKKIDARLKILIIESKKNVDSFKLVSGAQMNFTLSCTENIFFLFPVIEQVLRKIFYILFFKNGGFVLHASGVTYEKHAFIFIGESGAGKSTIMSLLKSNESFSSFADNNVFILFDKKKREFSIYKSPFLEWNVSYSGVVLDADLQTAMGGLFVLEKNSVNAISSQSFPDIVYRLVQQVQIPLKNLSKQEIENSRRLVFNFVTQNFKKIKKLSFKKDTSIVTFLLDEIKKETI